MFFLVGKRSCYLFGMPCCVSDWDFLCAVVCGVVVFYAEFLSEQSELEILFYS